MSRVNHDNRKSLTDMLILEQMKLPEQTTNRTKRNSASKESIYDTDESLAALTFDNLIKINESNKARARKAFRNVSKRRSSIAGIIDIAHSSEHRNQTPIVKIKPIDSPTMKLKRRLSSIRFKNLSTRSKEWQNILAKDAEARTADENKAIVTWLKANPHQFSMFENVADEHLLTISKYFSLCTCEKNEILFYQGEAGNYYYIILTGSIDVFYNSSGQVHRLPNKKSKDKDQSNKKIVRKSSIDEESMLAEELLDKLNDMEKETQEREERKLRHSMLRKIRRKSLPDTSLEEDVDIDDEEDMNASDDEQQFREALKEELDIAQMRKALRKENDIQNAPAKKKIQGHIEGSEGIGSCISSLYRGRGFGELGLMDDNSVRTATTRASTPTLLLRLHKIGLKILYENSPLLGDAEHRKRMSFIQTTFPTNQLTLTQQTNLRYQMQMETYLSKTEIITQGTPLKGIYFISKGNCIVKQTVKVNIAQPGVPLVRDDPVTHMQHTNILSVQEVNINLAHLSEGCYFGDIEILCQMKQTQSTVITTTPCVCYKISPRSFLKFFKNTPMFTKLQKLSKNKQELYDRQISYIRSSSFQMPALSSVSHTSVEKPGHKLGLPDMLVHFEYKRPDSKVWQNTANKKKHMKEEGPSTYAYELLAEKSSPTKIKGKLKPVESFSCTLKKGKTNIIHEPPTQLGKRMNRSMRAIAGYRKDDRDMFGERGAYDTEKHEDIVVKPVFSKYMLPTVDNMNSVDLKTDNIQRKLDVLRENLLSKKNAFKSKPITKKKHVTHTMAMKLHKERKRKGEL